MKIKYIIIFFTTLLFTSSAFALPSLAPFFAGIGNLVAGTAGLAVTGGTAIAIGVATVVVAAYAGTQLLGAMKMDFPDDMSAQAQSALSNQQGSTQPLPVIYGKRRVGATPIFYHVSGEENEFLHIVYAICEGEIQAVNQIYFNNDPILKEQVNYWNDGFSVIEEKYEGLVEYEIYNGTTTQTADQDLISQTGGVWTASDKLQGVAYAVVRLKFEPEVFGNTGIPQVNFDVVGKKTRSTTSGGTTIKVFSDNPADCIEDYLTNTIYGRSIPTSQIDSTAFTAARNICDTEVTVGGLTQKKYTCNGILNTNNKAIDNIQKLLTSCRGSLIFTGGKYKLLIDDTGTAVQTFDEDNIVGAFKLSLGGKEYKSNKVRATFFNNSRDMQGDFAIVESQNFLAEDNNLSLERSIELPFTDQMERALMIATINMKQSRQSLVFSFTSTIEGLRAEVGDVVFISVESLGWNTLNSNQGKKFKIMKLSIKSDDEVDITAREYDDDVYDFETIPAEDTTPNTNLPNFSFVDKPIIATTSEELISIPPTLFNRVTLNWTQPKKSSVESFSRGASV